MAGRTQQQQLLAAARRRKRPQPPVLSGVTGSYEDKDSDFLWYKFAQTKLLDISRSNHLER